MTPQQVDAGGPATERTSPAARRAIVAASVGTVIEWFDYTLYGTMAGLIVSKLFFPQVSPTVGLLGAFAAYGVAFLVRPLGGLILGRIGDRYGRKPALMISLVTMGVATVLMAFLPTFAMIGVWASVLLVLLRFLQGFGAGAEIAGALALVSEQVPLRRRGVVTAFLQSTSQVGTTLGTLAFLLVSLLPEDDLLSWGWRVPFLSAALLFVVAIYLRAQLEESPEYLRARERVDRATEAPRPLALLFATMKGRLIGAFMLVSAFNVVATALVVYGTSFLRNNVGFSATQALLISLFGGIAGAVVGPFVGRHGDRHGYRRIWLIALVVTVPGIFAYFAALTTGDFAVALIATVLAFAISYGVGAGAAPGMLVNLFPTEVRYSGIAAVREINAATVAGTFPFLATALVAGAGGAPWLVAGYIAFWTVAAIIALLILGATIENPDTPNVFVVRDAA